MPRTLASRSRRFKLLSASAAILILGALPHKCGVPASFGTPHLCGSEASKRELPGSESQNENCRCIRKGACSAGFRSGIKSVITDPALVSAKVRRDDEKEHGHF